MIRGLLKSFFLHLFIVGLFMYGAEIFKNNKKFEINEIPLDIVDISEQTITKTEKKNQEKATKKKNKEIKVASNRPRLSQNQNLQNLVKKIMSQKRKKKKLKMIKKNKSRKNELIIS